MIDSTHADSGIVPRRFTAREYLMMAGGRVWSLEQEAELIDGKLYKLPDVGVGHRQAAEPLVRLLQGEMGRLWRVRAGEVLQLNEVSVFRPALVLRRSDAPMAGPPMAADALLAIEIGDSQTVGLDRADKLPRYAAAGLPELWFVDLDQRLIARYHQPYGDAYDHLYTFREHETIVAATLPALRLPVATIVGQSVGNEEG